MEPRPVTDSMCVGAAYDEIPTTADDSDNVSVVLQ